MDRGDLGSRAGTRGRWTVRERLIAAFMIAYVTIHLAVPVLMLLDPLPTRFGWQMFSKVRFLDGYAVERADGTVEEIAVRSHVVHLRPEIDLGRALPTHLCQTVPGATAVHVRRADGQSAAVQCS